MALDIIILIITVLNRKSSLMNSIYWPLSEFLYRKDIISLEVAKAAASNPSDFERALHFE
jgi:hypothetical protein